MTAKKKSLFKNPLIQAFGLLLKKARKKEQKSSDELAVALGISASLYRLIESGSATLQPDKALDLIKALPNTPIEFRQLSILLVACVISEHRLSKGDLQQAILDLSAVDKSLGSTIEPLKMVMPELTVKMDPQQIAGRIEELAIPDRMLEFLARKSDSLTDQVTPSATKWGRNLVEGTPPLYLDLVETMVTELKRFPPKVTAHELAEWEKRHIGRFRRVYAVVETMQIVPDTYSEFDLRWIAEENFRQLSIISCSTVSQKKREQKSFQDFLGILEKEGWLKHKFGNNIGDICKLRFAHEQNGYQEKFRLLFSEDSQARASLLSNIGQLDPHLIQADQFQPRFKNVWAYEVIPRNFPHSGDCYHIALMDDRGVGRHSGYETVNCTWKETECWIELLESFWGS